VDSGGPKEACVDGVQIPTRDRTILRAKSGRPRRYPAVDILKGTQQGQNRYGADADWGELDGVHIDATNTTEPSVCGGDATLLARQAEGWLAYYGRPI